jgi:hypothetical protein
MSLEFALQYACPLRANYSEQHLRQWGRLSSLHAKLTTGDTSAPSADKIHWIERASPEIERMQEATAVCLHCPACLPLDAAGDGESVGCLGRINYPVEAQFEKFLADRVQLSLDTLDREDQPRLLRILIDPESPFDGEATKELRRVVTDEGLRFFELRVPIALSREGSRLTTDNIFDLLAGFRSEDSDATTYTRELPFEAAADYYDFLDLILRSELSQSEVGRLTSRSLHAVSAPAHRDRKSRSAEYARADRLSYWFFSSSMRRVSSMRLVLLSACMRVVNCSELF